LLRAENHTCHTATPIASQLPLATSLYVRT